MERLLVLLFAVLGCVLAFDESCSQGDNPNYMINNRYCNELGGDRALCYVGRVAHECCRTCNRLKIPGQRDCVWGDKVKGCQSLSARQCRNPYYNDRCCRTCTGTSHYCRDDPFVKINGYRCSEFLRYKGKHNCYQGTVLNSCCESCRALEEHNSLCKYGDKNSRQFTDGRTGEVYRCENLRGRLMHKCEATFVKADCCKTCANYRSYTGKRDVNKRNVEQEDKWEERRDVKHDVTRRDIMDILTG